MTFCGPAPGIFRSGHTVRFAGRSLLWLLVRALSPALSARLGIALDECHHADPISRHRQVLWVSSRRSAVPPALCGAPILGLRRGPLPCRAHPILMTGLRRIG